MKDSSRVLGGAILALGLVLGCVSLGLADIQVGAMHSLTTGLAPLGQRQINSAILASEEWNAKGGINGKKIDLIVEDTADSTTMAMTALDRVLGKDVCAILGPIWSFQLFALFPEVKKEGVPLLSTSGTRALTQKNNPWYFRLYPHDGITKRAYTIFAVQELKARRVAVMCVTTEYGKSGHELILETLKELGLEPVIVTWHNKDDKDMTGQLMSIKRANPDVIISQAHPADTAIILKQQRDLGIKVPHVASSAATMPYIHKLVGPAMDGVYVEAAALPNYDPDPKIQAWTKKYVRRFKTKPDSFALLYYDAANFLFSAIKAAGSNRAKIAKWLRGNRFQGLADQYVFDREQNGAHFAIIVQYRWKDGRVVPQLVKKYDLSPK
ncbi:MAG: ABC transporter substrate-binding protein [Deltaproteobacteria bacterium]|nr:ABC transporter substrate-binding protein [Deltaproteobacteria bacterium]